MQILPALDLYDNKVVRLSQGDYHRKQIYYDNPLDLVEQIAQHQINTIHVVDLEAAEKKALVHLPLLKEIQNKFDLRIHFGGGIRSYEDVATLFNNVLDRNKDKIMIGSLPFKDKKEFSKIANKYKDNIILTPDVWHRDIRISGWKESTNMNIMDYIRFAHNTYQLKYFLVTQIKRDGMMQGVDIKLYQELCQQFPDIYFIASGGITNLANIVELKKQCHLNFVVVGKALYEKKITMKEISHFNHAT